MRSGEAFRSDLAAAHRRGRTGHWRPFLGRRAIATGKHDDVWARNVTEGVEKLTGSLTVSAPGEHVLRLLMVDPAMVVDQIVVNTGGLPATYLAPPESYHLGATDRPAAAGDGFPHA